jgi:ankyrin repeat protein
LLIISNPERVTLALGSLGAQSYDVNSRDHRNQGEAPLHWAAMLGYEKTIEILLKAGADVNMQHDLYWTPLHFAARNGQEKSAELLVRAKADVDIADCSQWTALQLAVVYGDQKTAEVLLRANANVNTQTDRGITALHNATLCEDPEIVDLLLNAGAEVGIHDHDGNTALHDAAFLGAEEIVELLLNATALKVNMQDGLERMVLNSAADDDKEPVTVGTLRRANETVNAQNKDGRTALHLAAQRGNLEIAEMLVNAGAKTDVRDNGGETALQSVFDLPREEQWQKLLKSYG